MLGNYQRATTQQPSSFSPYPQAPYGPSSSAPYHRTSPFIPPSSYPQNSPYVPVAPYPQNSPYAPSPKVYSYMPPGYSSSPNASTLYGGYPTQPAPPYTQQPSPNALPPNQPNAFPPNQPNVFPPNQPNVFPPSQPNASTDVPPVKRVKYTGPRPELNEEQKAGRNLLMKWKDLRRAGIEVRKRRGRNV